MGKRGSTDQCRGEAQQMGERSPEEVLQVRSATDWGPGSAKKGRCGAYGAEHMLEGPGGSATDRKRET